MFVSLFLFVFGFVVLTTASVLKAQSFSAIEERMTSLKNDIKDLNNSVANATSSPNPNFTQTAEPDYPLYKLLEKGIPVTAILGIVSFASMDIAYDSSVTQVRTFMMANVPESQSASIMTTATRLASFSGIVNVGLGMLDLPSFLGPILNMDGVAATIIVIGMGTCSLIVTVYVCSIITAYCLNRNQQVPSDDEQKCLINKDVDKTSFTMDQNSRRNKKSLQLQPKKNPKSGFFSQWAFIFKMKMAMVLISILFTFGCSILVAVYSSNVATIEIVGGDPYALPGTEGNELYKKGLRIASAGTFISYLVYFSASFFTSKLLDLIGKELLFKGRRSFHTSSMVLPDPRSQNYDSMKTKKKPVCAPCRCIPVIIPREKMGTDTRFTMRAHH